MYREVISSFRKVFGGGRNAHIGGCLFIVGIEQLVKVSVPPIKYLSSRLDVTIPSSALTRHAGFDLNCPLIPLTICHMRHGYSFKLWLFLVNVADRLYISFLVYSVGVRYLCCYISVLVL